MRQTILVMSNEKQNARYFVRNNRETTLRKVSKWIEVITVTIVLYLYQSFYWRYKIANRLSSKKNDV